MKREGEDLSALDPNSLKRQDVSSIGQPPSPDLSSVGNGQTLGMWEQHISSKTGKPYWFNTLTGQTQWTSPQTIFPPKSPPPESAGEHGIGPMEGPKSDGTKISIDSAINYPKRPGQQRCTYYLTHGVCKFGESCKYDHPTDR